MGLPGDTEPAPDRARIESVFNQTAPSGGGEDEDTSRKSSISVRQTPSAPSTPKASAPPRPSREMRRISSAQSEVVGIPTTMFLARI
jgi:hypothetical protein